MSTGQDSKGEAKISLAILVEARNIGLQGSCYRRTHECTSPLRAATTLARIATSIVRRMLRYVWARVKNWQRHRDEERVNSSVHGRLSSPEMGLTDSMACCALIHSAPKLDFTVLSGVELAAITHQMPSEVSQYERP